KQPADVVVIGVEDDFEIVGVGAAVAAHQAGAHARRAVIVEHPGADVQRGPVEDEADLGALGRRLARARRGLPEVRGGRGRLPDGLVQTAIKTDLPLQGHGTRLGRRRGVNVLSEGRSGNEERGGAEDDEGFRHAGGLALGFLYWTPERGAGVRRGWQGLASPRRDGWGR